MNVVLDAFRGVHEDIEFSASHLNDEDLQEFIDIAEAITRACLRERDRRKEE